MNTAGKFIIGGLAAYGAYRVLQSILRPGEEGVGKAYKVTKKRCFQEDINQQMLRTTIVGPATKLTEETLVIVRVWTGIVT